MKVFSHTDLTIIRPSGITEIVRREGGEISANDFKKFQAATLAAGRGNIVSYISVFREMTEAETAKHGIFLANCKALSAMEKRDRAFHRSMGAGEYHS